MVKNDLVRCHVWLVDILVEKGSLTREEIMDLWLRTELSGGVDIPKSTFHRWRDEIFKQWGIEIVCERKGSRYYVRNMDELNVSSMKRWMFQVTAFSNLLRGNLGLQKRIFMEKFSSNQEIMESIIRAMSSNQMVKLVYQRYEDNQEKEVTAEPYFIKMYKQRVYSFMRLESGYICPYALDRMKSITILDTKYEMDEGFDAETFFEHCYGIVNKKSVKPEKVVLKAYDTEHCYLRDLPPHHSQRYLGKEEDYHLFEYFISPTLDFMGFILSRGDRLVVKEPKWLAQEIVKMHLGAVKKY